MTKLITVYTFPNGFAREAESMYTWLRHYNLNPSWGDFSKGQSEICLSLFDAECLAKMAEYNPARFGNASNIREAISKAQ